MQEKKKLHAAVGLGADGKPWKLGGIGKEVGALISETEGKRGVSNQLSLMNQLRARPCLLCG